MPEPPAQLPATAAERQRVISEEQAGGSLRGMTAWGRRIQNDPSTAPVKVNGIAVVTHGDDPDALRPLATIVMWVGAATPSNAVDYDFWFPATLAA